MKKITEYYDKKCNIQIDIVIEKIDAGFFFVGDRKEVKPQRLITEREVEEFLEKIRTGRLT